MRFRKRKSSRAFHFNSNNPADIKADINNKYGYNGDMLKCFIENKTHVVHKWHHYIPLYDRYFSPFRGKTIRFLEIGVGQGGGLQMWRKYFGEDAIIFGIDINAECAKYNGISGQVRTGSQTDQIFLESVVSEMGGLDIVLDDGSHCMDDVLATLNCLFPSLRDGGIYMVEDMHTAYWKRFGGGYHSKNNFFRLLLDVVHDMHHWYHEKKTNCPQVSPICSGIHIHDSIAVLEKNQVHEPVNSQIG
ncbi:MAG: hypothetical protein R3236_06220 [Phycisphaeraceae bacterium]|nr:hypothetical protein [Phycisphaeraceae bacterium]